MSSDGLGGSNRTYNVAEKEKEKEVQQIPTEYNEQQTLRFLRRQNQVCGEQRAKTISNIPIMATVGEVSKNLGFPADKEKIINFVQQQIANNPKCNEILPILQRSTTMRLKLQMRQD